MKILAFLQSPNLPPSKEKIWRRYAHDYQFHWRLLAQSMSGKRLMKAFGDEFQNIYWDNANPYPHATYPDAKHVCKSIQIVEPELIITFGRVAAQAYHFSKKIMRHQIPVFHCHHPNARHQTQEDLNSFARMVLACIPKRQESLSDLLELVKQQGY